MPATPTKKMPGSMPPADDQPLRRLFDKLGGVPVVARWLDVTQARVYQMLQRGWIEPERLELLLKKARTERHRFDPKMVEALRAICESQGDPKALENSVAKIFEAVGGVEVAAEAMGIGPARARTLRSRNALSPNHLVLLQAYANNNGIKIGRYTSKVRVVEVERRAAKAAKKPAKVAVPVQTFRATPLKDFLDSFDFTQVSKLLNLSAADVYRLKAQNRISKTSLDRLLRFAKDHGVRVKRRLISEIEVIEY